MHARIHTHPHTHTQTVQTFCSGNDEIGSPKRGKLVPEGTKHRTERTKIIISVSMKKRGILDPRLAHHFTWQKNARDINKGS